MTEPKMSSHEIITPVDRSQRILTDGKTEAEHPDYRNAKDNGQQKAYVVLSEEERAKGYVRPLRHAYVHVGPPAPRYALRDLTDEEKNKYAKYNYVKFEAYPEDDTVTGRFWTQEDLEKIDKGCGVETKMTASIAETYARDPIFYGATFCCGCNKHLPVCEFVWSGSQDRVGS